MPTQRNDDMLLEEAYDNVISYLENNPIYIPLFLYTLYSFFSSLSKYMYIFEVKKLDDSDVIDKKDYLLLKDKIDNKDDGWLFFNFNLWLHTKNTNTLNIAANMFLNTFSYGYTSIKNPHNFHINISKEINTLSTKDIIQTKRVGGADIVLDYQHKIVQEYVLTSYSHLSIIIFQAKIYNFQCL